MAAGKGGGSWKVAYADFVTAMMAFFLVMWIGAQDSKTRQSVANYFIDPTGTSKKPSRSGAMMSTVEYGNQPEEQGSRMNRGRDSYSAGEPQGPATTLVSKWLAADDKRLKAWKDKAQACRVAAARAPEVLNRNEGVDKRATRELAKLLSAEFTGDNPAKANDVYQDLVLWSLREVKWEEVAEDLLR
jgi:flagellar motor protein MotB